jgi:hypothetical protein
MVNRAFPALRNYFHENRCDRAKSNCDALSALAISGSNEGRDAASK